MLEELCFSPFRNRCSSGDIALNSPFFLQSEASIATDNSQSEIEKLHNIVEKLHNNNELTEAEKRLVLSKSVQDYAYLLNQEAEKHAAEGGQLSFTKDELDQYVAHRKEGLAAKSHDWINRSAHALWNCTKGQVSQTSMGALRTFVLEKYASVQVHKIVLGFATAFLKHLSKIKLNSNYLSFAVFLELPRTVRVRKAVTGRIVTKTDIAVLFKRIESCAENGKINAQKARNYRAFGLLASYTGLRPSTLQRLTVGQFKAALNEEKPVLHILAEQEKSRVEHYVPLHPLVVNAISDVLSHDFSEKDDAKPFFMFFSFGKWLQRQKIPLPRVRDSSKAHLWLSDFRKFAEQFGDVIGWDATNRKYILAHGMTGVDWSHYKYPLQEDVYDIYIRYWQNVELVG